MARASARPIAQGTRAVLYLRQSTHTEESISLELQETAGRTYCEQRGYSVVAVESDPGISGRTWNRPAVVKVMEMIERRDADVIVLWKWSRLSRARLDWAVAVDKVENAGGRIESATEPLDTTTSAGRLARGMLAEFAAFESERIGDGWKESQQRRRLRGLPASGGDRFGYVREGSEYRPDPESGPLLAELYRRHIGGEGFTRLTRILNEAGHRTVTGVAWSHDKLRSILDSGFGAGLIIQGRGVDARFYPGAHPSVISADEWAAYVDRRRQVRRAPRVTEPKYFLTGLVVCGDCGGPMRSVRRNNAQDGYGCGNYLRSRMGRFVTCRRTAVEGHVLGALRAFAADVDAQTRLEMQHQKTSVVAINDAQAIAQRIDALRAQATAITLRWSSGKMSEGTYESAVTELERQISELEARERVHRERPAAQQARRSAISMLDRWEDLDPLEQRAVVAAFILRVRIVPPTVKKIGGAGPVRFEIDWAFDR